MSCSCSSIDILPLIIASSETQIIKVNVSAPEGESDLTGQIQLFTDDPQRRTLVLTFTAHSSREKTDVAQATANPL